MKAFPQILKVLYNKDCISDQAIIYWYQKGSKPQGRQHFLKITEPLVQVCIFITVFTQKVSLLFYNSSCRNRRVARKRTENVVMHY